MPRLEPGPTDHFRTLFRIAAIAFVWAGATNVGTSYIGSPQHVNYAGIWTIGLLSAAGGAVTWFLPWHRLPVQRFISVIVLPGLVLLTFMLFYTGGVHSQVTPVYVAFAVFMAAAFDLGTAFFIVVATVLAASLPLFVQGWDDTYGRSLIVLAATSALCAFIPAQVRRALIAEYEKRRRQQEESYVATIGALAAALDAKDRYTEAHSRETAALAVSVGRRLGLQEDALRWLEYGALLHDIGKIGIPGYILHKPGSLTPEEFAIMKEHPVIGERILASVPFLASLGPVVRAEHERWDGGGYPDGLKGEEIPIAARVIHACDAFHAMASDRAYRRALSDRDIRAEFRRQSGKQFDPRVVDVLLEVIERERPQVTAPAQAAGTPAPAAPLSGPRSWAQHLETIEALGEQLGRASSIEETCRKIGETVVTLLPHDQCRVLLLDEARRQLDVVYLTTTERSEYTAVTASNAGVALGEGIAGWVAETKRGVVLGDAERHPKAAHVEGTGIIEESLLAVPVVFQDEVLGVLMVLKVGLNQYSLDQLRLLTILANQAAVSIANARLIDRLAATAQSDPLTGLDNRQAFEAALDRRLDADSTAPLALLLLDVRDLGRRNQRDGYAAGDEVLRTVARAIRAELRPQDCAARWISDEFLILCSGATEDQARTTAERVQAALKEQGIAVGYRVAPVPAQGRSREAALRLLAGSPEPDGRRLVA